MRVSRRLPVPTALDLALGAFVVGVLLLLRLPALPSPWPWAALAAAALGLACARRRPLLTGLLAGFCWAWAWGLLQLEARLPVACDGEWVRITGVVADLPRRRPLDDERLQQRFRLHLEHIAPGRCRGPRRLSLAYYGERRLAPGERWTFSARLRLPWGEANPGGRNRQDYYARERIHAVGSVRSGDARRLDPAGRRAVHHQARDHLRVAVAGTGLAPAPAALLTALLIGDQSALAAHQWELLRRFGVVHLLVISGLHVSLVAGLGWCLGGYLARALVVVGLRGAWGWLPGSTALAVAGSYGALAGFTLPTQRALVMLACFIVAALVGRRARSARNLLLAAALVLALNPLAATGSGFWLSFAAVGWLLWYTGRDRGARGWRAAAALHGFMALAMAPLTSWWFGGASVAAALANALLVPLVALYLVPLALAGGACWPFLPALGEVLWRLAAWPLGLLLAGGEALLARHGDHLYLHTGAGALEALLAVAGVLVLFGARGARRLAGLLALLPLALPDPARPAPAPTLTVLDVGQGTAVVYRSGTRTLVYDTGGGDPEGSNAAAAVLVPFLRHRGVRRVDDLVVSHPDRDHSAGVATLRAALPVERVHAGRALASAPEASLCRTGRSWRWPDGSRFRLLTASAPAALSRNDASCVLLIEVRGQRFLLPGDIGVDRERQLVRYWRDELRADWLLVAHHGSATSSSAAWLRAVRPRQAVFTHGRANPFGHPAPAVLDRYCRAGIRLYGTAASGALQFRAAPDGSLSVSAHRSAARRFWRSAPPLTALGCAAYNRRTPR